MKHTVKKGTWNAMTSNNAMINIKEVKTFQEALSYFNQVENFVLEQICNSILYDNPPINQFNSEGQWIEKLLEHDILDHVCRQLRYSDDDRSKWIHHYLHDLRPMLKKKVEKTVEHLRKTKNITRRPKIKSDFHSWYDLL